MAVEVPGARYLTGRRPVAWLVVSAVALSFGSLAQGFALDDRIYTTLIRAQLQGRWDVPWYEVASMMSRDGAEGIAALIDEGRIPWWSDPGLRWALFRPLAVLSHYLDLALYPGLPALMHVQNLLWYGALLSALAWLYRRLWWGAAAAGEATAWLSLALFALTPGHGQVVSWLASRNSIMFVVFSVLSVACHDRARRGALSAATGAADATDGRRTDPRFLLLSLLCLLLGLLSSEGAIATLGYLFAHALCIDRGPWRRRALSLLPALGLVLTWQLAYRAAGFGTANSGVYLDPLTAPLRFLAVVPGRVWWMLCELLGLPMSLEAQPPYPRAVGGAVAAVVTAPLLIIAALPARVSARLLPGGPGPLRMCVLGAAASLLPLCAAHVSYRMLLMPAVGTCGALACVAAPTLAGLRPRGLAGARRGGAVLAAGLAVAILLLRVPVAAALVPVMGRSHLTLDRALVAHARGFPPDAPGRVLIVANTPYYLATMFSLYLRAGSDPRRVRNAYVLGAHDGPVRLSRPAHHTLVLAPVGGYLREFTSLVARDPAHPFAVGSSRQMGPVRVTVDAVTSDGRPAVVRFDFANIDDPALRFVDVRTEGLSLPSRSRPLPAVGESITLRPRGAASAQPEIRTHSRPLHSSQSPSRQ